MSEEELTFLLFHFFVDLLMIPFGLYCLERLQNIYSDIYLQVLSSTRPYQALIYSYLERGEVVSEEDSLF